MRTHEEDTAGPCSFASFDVSSKVLSGTSHDASEEVLFSPHQIRLLRGGGNEKAKRTDAVQDSR